MAFSFDMNERGSPAKATEDRPAAVRVLEICLNDLLRESFFRSHWGSPAKATEDRPVALQRSILSYVAPFVSNGFLFCYEPTKTHSTDARGWPLALHAKSYGTSVLFNCVILPSQLIIYSLPPIRMVPLLQVLSGFLFLALPPISP